MAKFKYEPVGKSKQELEQEELEEQVNYIGNSGMHFDKKLWRGLELLGNPKVPAEHKEWLAEQLKEDHEEYVSDFYLFQVVPGY